MTVRSSQTPTVKRINATNEISLTTTTSRSSCSPHHRDTLDFTRLVPHFFSWMMQRKISQSPAPGMICMSVRKKRNYCSSRNINFHLSWFIPAVSQVNFFHFLSNFFFPNQIKLKRFIKTTRIQRQVVALDFFSCSFKGTTSAIGPIKICHDISATTTTTIRSGKFFQGNGLKNGKC